MSPQPRRRRQAAVLGTLTEAHWQAQVVGLARFYQWRVYHAPAGGKGGRVDREQIGAGFPDLVLLRVPELIVAELKPDKGSRRTTVASAAARPDWLQAVDLADNQADWLQDFAALGAALPAALELVDPEQVVPSIDAYVWRPRDFPEVERRLALGRAVVPFVNRAGAPVDNDV